MREGPAVEAGALDEAGVVDKRDMQAMQEGFDQCNKAVSTDKMSIKIRPVTERMDITMELQRVLEDILTED